jgi:hypothetical protein
MKVLVFAMFGLATHELARLFIFQTGIIDPLLEVLSVIVALILPSLLFTIAKAW